MDDQLKFHYDEDRIWLEDEDGHETACVEFPEVEPGIVNIRHTWVDESLAGQGIASRLIREVTEVLRVEGKRALVTCGYAQSWFSDHMEYLFLLVEPEDQEDVRHI